MNVRVVCFVIGLLIFAVGTASADDKRILDVMLKKGIITKTEYDQILKEAEEAKPTPQPELRFEQAPTKLVPKGDIQQAIESKKAADKQQAAVDQQMVREGQLKGWLGALRDGFTPQDSEYQAAPASTMLLHLRRQERIGFHIHNLEPRYLGQYDLAGSTGVTKSQFQLGTSELELSGYLFPGLLFGQVVIEPRDSLGRGLGDSLAKNINANNAPTGIVRDGFADLVLKEPEMVVRVGQQRIPFGIEPQTPGGLLPFTSRAFMDLKLTRNGALIKNPTLYPGLTGFDNARFSNAEFLQERDIGVQARGRLGGDYFDYALGAFNGSGINVSDSNSSKDFIGRLGFNPHPGLRFGLSEYRGTQLDILKESGLRNRVGSDFELTHDLIPRVHIMGEMADGRDVKFHRFTWYMQGMLEILPQRTPTSPLLLVKARYDEMRDNLNVHDNNYSRTTFGIDYYFLNAIKLSSGYWQQVKFQLEYEVRRHTALNQASYVADAFSQNLLIAQFTVRY